MSTDLSVLYDQVERNRRWVPDQESWLGVAAAGTNGSLVGTPTTDISISPDESFRWSLELGTGLQDVDRSTGVVQTLVTGRVEAGRLPPSDELLVVVNDTVAGVAHLARDSATSGAITGLVTEELVPDGANDVNLLLADGNGGWVAGASEEITLELIADDGHAIDVGVEGSRRIQVDSIERTDVGWEVTGWAADVNEKLTPDTFYVFAGDRLLASGPPNVENENVVRWFESEDLLKSGFSFEVEGEDVPEEVDRLLVVAEFGSEAVADPATLTR